MKPTRPLAPFRALVEQGHVDVLQPDLARCGGFTVARQIALLERSSAVEIVPHCFSTGILVAASLHFVATLDRADVVGVLGRRLAAGERDPARAIRAQGRMPRRPVGAGLGVELDEDALLHHRVA